MMLPELAFHIKTFTRLIYFVTPEEDRFLIQLQNAMKAHTPHVKVYNAAFGLIPLTQLIGDWASKAHAIDGGTNGIHDALIAIYKEPTPTDAKFYVITDPERWLKDEHVQRRILNILHQVHNDTSTVKVLICVGSHRFVPEKLARYTEVVQDTGLSSDEILGVVTATCSLLKIEPPEDTDRVFKSMTGFEIQAALIQTKRRARFADPKLLSEYRFKQLRKTDLVHYIDTSDYTFESVGGVGRFKNWVSKMKSAWTPEGQAFGLEPPKGVLAVGVWGTGKSLSIKALGQAWGLPVVQLDMGRLRSSRVGESESNVFQAIKIIEAVAPCIIWIDEAEKSLSGGQSSGQTDSGTTSRMIGALSTWMQETKAPVCIAMTANSLKTLPVEFVNRMDERWFFDLPSQEDRIDILKIHLKKRKQDPRNYNLALLAEKAESMVGREIEQCLKAAMTLSFVGGHSILDETILGNELEHKPRIVRTMADEIKETLDWVGFDPKVDDGVRARFAADPKGQDRKFAVA
jgi:AAA+ superfamily predicted ATPase